LRKEKHHALLSLQYTFTQTDQLLYGKKLCLKHFLGKQTYLQILLDCENKYNDRFYDQITFVCDIYHHK